MHGEQGAMLTAAKIVKRVPWIDANTTPPPRPWTRHAITEVFARYLDENVATPTRVNPFLEEQITALLEDSRWDIAYLGMQIVIDEPRRWAAFGDMLRRTEEPLSASCSLRDERRGASRGVRVLTCASFYPGLSDRS